MKKKILSGLCVGMACLFWGNSLVFAEEKAPVLTVSGGQISGTAEENGIYTYKGIPYAASPVGELRWKAPAANEKVIKRSCFPLYGRSLSVLIIS